MWQSQGINDISRGSLLYYDIMACIYTYVGLAVPVYFKTRLYFFKLEEPKTSLWLLHRKAFIPS